MAPHDVASIICPALGRGVTRSKRRAMQWLRKAAELGHAKANSQLAAKMSAKVEGHLKDFKVCPQCKTARYCGDACQKQDWTAGGHRETCGTRYANKAKQ